MGSFTVNFFSVGRGLRLRYVKFLLQRIRKVIFFIKNPNLTKKKKFWRVGGEGVGVARVSDCFFQRNPSLKKKFFSGGGEGKKVLASVS